MIPVLLEKRPVAITVFKQHQYLQKNFNCHIFSQSEKTNCHTSIN